MISFIEWLLKLEIGMVPEPGKPEKPSLTAFPTVTLDGSDLPPTPLINMRHQRDILLGKKAMKKRMKRR